ncbi:alpha/beta hydrolase [Nocardioides dongxiaopingii]|uniref:alpha/beta hydrolase n=1 Tax=Nocardioides sp. S-1144 TaxID=2582905 RepID=UPI0011655537|nr:alpha/beta hydrolase [Nocardioides sp. S-1144]QDH11126.1 alpha/beta hydrolase [Nocardioides sp. S-1144]
MPLDPGIASLLQLIDGSPYPPMSEGTPDDARRALRSMTVDLVTPETRVPVGSVEETEVAGRPARLYRPVDDGPLPTLVYLHGGGFVIGDLDTHDQTCRRLCAGAAVVVLAIDYRLAPEARFPAAVDDALAAVRWADEHRGELGGGEVLAVGGDSAGGNLAAVAALELGSRVDAQVLLYPATHMTGDYPSRTENAEGYFLDLATMGWFGGHYLGHDADRADRADRADPRHSPLLADLAAVDGDLAPALVVTVEYDPLRDEGEAYAALLERAGVPVETVRYDGLVHGFIDMGPMSPAAAAALDDVVERVGRLLRR